MIQRAVAFDDPVLRKSCFLKLTIYIRSEDEVSARLVRGDIEQLLETGVGDSRPIEIETVAVKSPGEFRRFLKPPWLGHFGKVDAYSLAMAG